MTRTKRGFFSLRPKDVGFLLAVVAVLLAMQMCREAPGELPPIETCEPTNNPPDGRCAWNTDSCSWDCPEQEPPPPLLGAVPGDYVHVDRVDGIIDGTSVRNPGLLHGMVFGGWRDPQNVAHFCSFACDGTQGLYFGMTCDELRAFGDTGLRLIREAENQIVPALRKDNRRCRHSHRLFDQAFLKSNGDCARAEITKTRFSRYRGRLNAHKKAMFAMVGRAQTCADELHSAGGGSYDSIAGWCRSMRTALFRLSDCP